MECNNVEEIWATLLSIDDGRQHWPWESGWDIEAVDRLASVLDQEFELSGRGLQRICCEAGRIAKNARYLAKKADHWISFSPNTTPMKATAKFTHHSTREILSAALVLLLASFTALAATTPPSRSRLAAP